MVLTTSTFKICLITSIYRERHLKCMPLPQHSKSASLPGVVDTDALKCLSSRVDFTEMCVLKRSSFTNQWFSETVMLDQGAGAQLGRARWIYIHPRKLTKLVRSNFHLKIITIKLLRRMRLSFIRYSFTTILGALLPWMIFGGANFSEGLWTFIYRDGS